MHLFPLKRLEISLFLMEKDEFCTEVIHRVSKTFVEKQGNFFSLKLRENDEKWRILALFSAEIVAV